MRKKFLLLMSAFLKWTLIGVVSLKVNSFSYTDSPSSMSMFAISRHAVKKVLANGGNGTAMRINSTIVCMARIVPQSCWSMPPRKIPRMRFPDESNLKPIYALLTVLLIYLTNPFEIYGSMVSLRSTFVLPKSLSIDNPFSLTSKLGFITLTLI